LPEIGKLVVRIEADLAQMKRELRRGEQETRAASERMRQAFDGFGQGIDRQTARLSSFQAVNRELAASAGEAQALFGREIEQSTLRLEAAERAGRNLRVASTDAARAIGAAFDDAILRGGRFSDVLRGLEQDIIRLVLRATVTQPLQDLFATSLAGTAGAFDGLTFGGPRAGGGAVAPRRAFLVGERGPELFVPGKAGTILPTVGGSRALGVQPRVRAIAAATVGRADGTPTASPAVDNRITIHMPITVPPGASARDFRDSARQVARRAAAAVARVR
jgi:hypothetical protein